MTLRPFLESDEPKTNQKQLGASDRDMKLKIENNVGFFWTCLFRLSNKARKW